MLCLFLVHSLSWWGHAHMIIGRISETFLTASQHKKIENLIHSYQLPLESIAEAASWQDQLKDDNGLRLFYNWHFSDDAIIDGQCEGCNIMAPTYNITSYLNSAYETLMDETTTSGWAWAFHIRSILHFVGDIHMPLHNSARYTTEFPNGDKGGNDYKLNCNYGSSCNNIHFLWDSVGNMYNIFNPLIPKYAGKFQENVTQLIKDHPENGIGYDTKTYLPDQWHSESYRLASNAYITPMNEWPSKEYFKFVQDNSVIRISLAGYRLGNFLASVADKIPDINRQSKAGDIFVWSLNGILLIISIVMVFLNRKKNNSYVSAQ